MTTLVLILLITLLITIFLIDLFISGYYIPKVNEVFNLKKYQGKFYEVYKQNAFLK